jgi:anaerobic C4-dicarboxylate transporter
MIQSQKNDLLGQWQSTSQQRNPLLQRHPVLIPLVLFVSSILLAMTSFFTDNLFPVLTLIGIPSALLCYLFAAVLGLCGVLVSITGLLELCDTFDHRQIQLALAPQSKGQHYDCN